MNLKAIPYPSAKAVELAALDADTLASLFQAAATDEHLKGLMPGLRDEICRRWMREQTMPKLTLSALIAISPCPPATHTGSAHTGA